MSKFIGVIAGAETGRIYAVINPDMDDELDNPRWLLLKTGREVREPLRMVQIARGEYEAASSMQALQKLVEKML